MEMTSEDAVAQKAKIYCDLSNSLLKVKSANRSLESSKASLTNAFLIVTDRFPRLNDSVNDSYKRMVSIIGESKRLEDRLQAVIDTYFSEGEKIAYKVKFGL